MKGKEHVHYTTVGAPDQTILSFLKKCYYFYMFSVYILQCADGTYYVGSTNDLVRRFHQHNNAKSGAHYTKIRRPVVLKYSEEHPTLTEVRKRESELKSWKRNKKEQLWLKK